MQLALVGDARVEPLPQTEEHVVAGRHSRGSGSDGVEQQLLVAVEHRLPLVLRAPVLVLVRPVLALLPRRVAFVERGVEAR